MEIQLQIQWQIQLQIQIQIQLQIPIQIQMVMPVCAFWVFRLRSRRGTIPTGITTKLADN